MQKKMDQTSIDIKYQTSGFILIYCFIRNKSKIAVEGLNVTCLSSPWTRFRYFIFPRNLITLQKLL